MPAVDGNLTADRPWRGPQRDWGGVGLCGRRVFSLEAVYRRLARRQLGALAGLEFGPVGWHGASLEALDDGDRNHHVDQVLDFGQLIALIVHDERERLPGRPHAC